MKLYDCLRAPNPRRVRWFMAEKGIDDVEIVTLSIMSGEHKSPEYKAKAGLAHMPALELDDGTVITESVAICRYLESVYPEPNLFGRDPKETAIIEMWLRRTELMVATPIMQGVRHSHPGMAALEAQIPEVAAYNLGGAMRSLKMLDRRLAESAFIATDRVTIADVVAVASIDFGRMIKWRPDPQLVQVNRWFDAMLARPAAKAGMAA
ncbi:glutathione S-transferase [Caulobacter sp.]|uniref:glutathione S-transferase family protein n=1 Tax=Caulobacter sp. TaxID=78 RepID=UPI001B270511|nr:glutathione S-transferase [Caulobacter sp.]MBO9542969.1 glutathione S-transferase [Caulobacter sp.]